MSLTQYRDMWQIRANTVMNLGIQQNARNFLNSYVTTSFSKDSVPRSYFVWSSNVAAYICC